MTPAWDFTGNIWWMLMFGLWMILFFDDAVKVLDAWRARRKAQRVIR